MEAAGGVESRSDDLLNILLTRSFDPEKHYIERLMYLWKLREYINKADVGGPTIKDAQDLFNKTVEEMEQLQTRLPVALLEKYKTQWESLPDSNADLNRLLAKLETRLDQLESTIRLPTYEYANPLTNKMSILEKWEELSNLAKKVTPEAREVHLAILSWCKETNTFGGLLPDVQSNKPRG